MRTIDVRGCVSCCFVDRDDRGPNAGGLRTCALAPKSGMVVRVAPDWCPLRPANGGPVLVVLSEGVERG